VRDCIFISTRSNQSWQLIDAGVKRYTSVIRNSGQVKIDLSGLPIGAYIVNMLEGNFTIIKEE
jgi:hypothetical protein